MILPEERTSSLQEGGELFLSPKDDDEGQSENLRQNLREVKVYENLTP